MPKLKTWGLHGVGFPGQCQENESTGRPQDGELPVNTQLADSW